MADIKPFDYIKINGEDVEEMYSSYVCKNNLTYETDPIIYPVSFAKNSAQIDFAYRPKVEFVFAKINIESYRWMLWEVNQPFFTVEYYDYTLGKNVVREMCIASEELESLQVYAGNLEGIIGLTISFESRYGYESKEDLENDNPIIVGI